MNHSLTNIYMIQQRRYTIQLFSFFIKWNISEMFANCYEKSVLLIQAFKSYKGSIEAAAYALHYGFIMNLWSNTEKETFNALMKKYSMSENIEQFTATENYKSLLVDFKFTVKENNKSLFDAQKWMEAPTALNNLFYAISEIWFMISKLPDGAKYRFYYTEIGKIFNKDIHQAMNDPTDKDKDTGTILLSLCPGFEINGISYSKERVSVQYDTAVTLNIKTEILNTKTFKYDDTTKIIVINGSVLSNASKKDVYVDPSGDIFSSNYQFAKWKSDGGVSQLLYEHAKRNGTKQKIFGTLLRDYMTEADYNALAKYEKAVIIEYDNCWIIHVRSFSFHTSIFTPHDIYDRLYKSYQNVCEAYTIKTETVSLEKLRLITLSGGQFAGKNASNILTITPTVIKRLSILFSLDIVYLYEYDKKNYDVLCDNFDKIQMLNKIDGSYNYVDDASAVINNLTYHYEGIQLSYQKRDKTLLYSTFILNKIDLPDNYKNIIKQTLKAPLEAPFEAPIKTPESRLQITNSAIDFEIEKVTNENSFFVLPSQLNGAEYPNISSIVSKIRQYMNDLTGGPRGQLAVHPAIGQFIIDNAANTRNINGLNSMKKILEIVVDDNAQITSINGYLKVPQDNNQSELILDNLNEFIIIGAEDVLVDGYYYGRKTTPSLGANTKEHRVNMIYASAIPIGTYTNGYTNTNLQNIGNYIMIAEYYGSLLMAYKKYINVKIKVYFMPLGGGVFNNNHNDIFKNMIIAIRLLEIKYADVPQKLEIHVLTWSGSATEYTIYNEGIKTLYKI